MKLLSCYDVYNNPNALIHLCMVKHCITCCMTVMLLYLQIFEYPKLYYECFGIQIFAD